jgi:hypothetical protein
MMIDVVILFFMLGLVAGLLKAELRLPAAIYEFLSMILLIAIGLKGGIELAKQPMSSLLPQMFAVVLMGAALTLVGFFILLYWGRFKRVDAASIAAHYGSVSVATFAVAVSYLHSQQIPFEEHMSLLLVLLEVPAIIVAVLLVKGVSAQVNWPKVMHEIFFGKSIVLLIGGLMIGWLAGPEGLKPIEPLFFDLFKGILALFLLEMGLITAMQIGTLRQHGLFLVGFGVVMPLFSSLVGTALAMGLGLSVGGTAMLATLAASASYIAVPAAMRISLPQANPTLSLGGALGITFPFNVIVGVPLYLQMAQRAHAYFGV